MGVSRCIVLFLSLFLIRTRSSLNIPHYQLSVLYVIPAYRVHSSLLYNRVLFVIETQVSRTKEGRRKTKKENKENKE